jgi:hypothetical protein
MISGYLFKLERHESNNDDDRHINFVFLKKRLMWL